MASKRASKKDVSSTSATEKTAPTQKSGTARTKRVASRATAPEAERTRYFTASWCPPCQLVHRMLAKHPGLAARLEILDVDRHGSVADRYDIEAIPTFVRPDGRRRTGAMTARQLEAFLDG